MRKLMFLLFVPLLLVLVSCEDDDIEEEKEAIRNVIENETNSFLARDFDQQSKSFLQDESLTVMFATNKSYNYIEGWDKVSYLIKETYLNEPGPITDLYEFTNYRFNFYDDCVMVTYDEIVYNNEGEVIRSNKSVRFLVEVDDEWKIAYLSWVETLSFKN